MSRAPAGDRFRDIAIVGIGCQFPKANDLAAYWDNIRNARVCFSDVPRWRWNHDLYYHPSAREIDKTYARKVGFIDDVRGFAAMHYGLAPLRVKVMDPQHRLLLDAVRMALEDAGYGARPPAPERHVGVFMGLSVSEYKDLVTTRLRSQAIFDGQFGRVPGMPREVGPATVEDIAPVRAFSIAGNLLNMAAATVAQTFDLRGPAFTIDAACSSSLVAVYEAILHLRAGQCDAALAGGVYLNLTPDNLVGFSRIGAISKSDACRPFDVGADGFVLGEGVGVVYLKRLPDALRDGDRVYAVIRGAGINNDGRGEGPMTPRLEGQREALARAYAECDFGPEAVGFIEAHGTATGVGDVVEVGALRDYYHAHKRGPVDAWLSSVKANVGHTMSAAGVAGLIKASMVLSERIVPPQAAFEEPLPTLDLDGAGFKVSREERPLEAKDGAPRRAAVSSFGFGGTNCHVVLEEAPAEAGHRRSVVVPAHIAVAPEPFVLSAPTAPLLADHLAAVRRALDESEAARASLADLAFTLASRKHEAVRVAFVARSRAELKDKLAQAEAVARGGAPVTGIQYAAAPLPEDDRAVAFLFPGQGAQAIDLCAGLYRRYPRFRARLDALAASLNARDERLPKPLLDYLFPGRRGAPYDAAEATRELTRTEVCQPAMAALGLALADFAVALGVAPSMMLGHSLGEFVALGAAGALTPEASLALVADRGRAMAALEEGGRDVGAMAAVAADPAAVKPWLDGQDGVVMANLNHPKQTVIAGTTEGVVALVERMKAAGLQATRLQVSHAFHSPLVEGAARDIARLVEQAELYAPRVPVVSCIDVGPYPADPDGMRAILTKHATAPVDFTGGIARAAEEGARVFVQVGAGSALLAMARATLAAEGIKPAALLTLAEAGAEAASDEGGRLAETLCALFALGVPLDLRPLYEDHVARAAWLPPTPLVTEPYWCVVRDERERPALPALVPAGSERAAAPPSPSTTQATTTMATANDSLVALFREQMAVFQAQNDLIGRQLEALGAGGVPLPAGVAAPQQAPRPAVAAPVAAPQQAPVAAPAPPAPVASPPAPTTNGAHAPTTNGAHAPVNGHAAKAPPANGAAAPAPAPAKAAAPARAKGPSASEERLFDIVSAVSAFPRSGIKPDQRLVSDLGFDSLMVVELSTKVAEAFPTLGGIPRSLFSMETTVRDLARFVARADEDGAAPDAAGAATASAPAKVDVRRYVPVRVTRPLPARPTDAALPWSGPAAILDDGAGVATALAALLEAAGSPARVVADVHAIDLAAARALIDLRHLALASTELPLDGDRLRAPVAAALALARAASAHVPECVAFAWSRGEAAPVAGFAKALAREWTSARVKSIQFTGAADAKTLAQRIFDELAGTDAAVETIWADGVRHVDELRAAPLTAAALPARPVVAIAGGGRGLGARLALDLAAQSKARLALLGRSAAGEEVASLVGKIRAAGGEAIYLACDITDEKAVAAALADARTRLGPIEIAVHAAGVIADAPVGKKADADLARVFDTKVKGALALFRAVAGDPVRAMLLYSSWAGRFGNASQTDYAAANHTLAALAARFSVEKPGLRAVAIDLPPWDGTEMVNTIPAAVRAMMRSEGVTFLDDASGLPALRAELCATTAPSGESLLGGDLAPQREDVARVRLTLDAHPYLDHHRVSSMTGGTGEGVPVLPLAGAMDYAAAAAVRVLGPLAPGAVLRLDRFELLDGVRLDGGAATLQVVARAKGAGAEIELFHFGPAGSGRRTLAYRGHASVAAEALAPVAAPAGGEAPPLSLADFYAHHTFHGPRLRGVLSVEEIGPGHVRGRVRAARPDELLAAASAPARFAVDPLLVDSSFQLAAYWARVQRGRAGLPVGFAEYRALAPIEPGAAIDCLFVLEKAEGDLHTGHVDYRDESGRLVAQLRGMQAVLPKVGEPITAASAVPALITDAEPTSPNAMAAGGEPAIDEAYFRVEAFPEYLALRQRLDMAQAVGIANPYFNLHERVTNDTTVIGGREMVNYSSYNYLGLSGDPAINAAVAAAVERYGTSVSASRVASGEKPLHRELEAAIARFLGCEDSIVLVGGHATNVSIIGHLMGPGDLILHDSLAHDSILGGAKLSGAKRRPFPHNDWAALDRTLTELRPYAKKVLIAIEGTYSMDGDIPALDKFIEIKKRHKCFLLVDEAHSLGVLGDTGRGVGEHFHVNRADVDLWMGTLSKSLSSCGGYIAGSHALVEYLKYTTPGFVFSVGISPANAAAALASIHEIEKRPELVHTLHRRSRFFLEACRAHGINTGMSEGTAVVPCIVGNSWDCLQLAQALGKRGINVQPILYPAVEEHLARLRFFITASHKESQLRETADILAEELGKLSPDYLKPRAAHAQPASAQPQP